ncbi:uncharacterized protein LOC126162441 [Schistocerca cancellata]|uniref:uncharacterized protein LOC126162441 n=1 Tax=Schistocerca cancellata TaxID=274614 RepID=UPI00211806CA|nr:uncharacterized protein LOC126162441 [Schistocerca cancellata]
MVICDVNMRKSVSSCIYREDEEFDTADDVLKYVYDNTCAWCCDVFDEGEPTLRCAECDAHLCATCFSQGQQPGQHRNYHRYTVIPPTKLSSAVGDEASGWTISEELTLLSALEKYGYGDWEAVSEAVARTPEECQRRYDSRYVSSAGPFSWLHEVSNSGSHICRHTMKRNSDQRSKEDDLDRDLFASFKTDTHLPCLDTSLMQKKPSFGKLLVEKQNSEENSLPLSYHPVVSKNLPGDITLKGEHIRQNTQHHQQLAVSSPPPPSPPPLINVAASWRQTSFGLNRGGDFKKPGNEMCGTVKCLNGHVVNSTLGDSSREKASEIQQIIFDARKVVGGDSVPESQKQCCMERNHSVTPEKSCCVGRKMALSCPLLEDESCTLETGHWNCNRTLTLPSENTTFICHHSDVSHVLNNSATNEQILEDQQLYSGETHYQSYKQEKNMSSEEFLEACGHRLAAAEILPEYLSQYMHTVRGTGNKRLPVPCGKIHKKPGKKPLHRLRRPPPSSIPGYSAARSEFDIDYDNHAELMTVCVAHVDWSDDDPDADLQRALTLAAVTAYNRRLSKRLDAHKLIRGLGLVSSSGGLTLGPGRLAPFARLLAPLPAAYHMLLTSLSHSVDLRRRITCLSQLRSEAGLWRISQCALYRRLARNRELAIRERRADRQRINLTSGPSTVRLDGIPAAPRSRTVAAPLDVSALPGANRLSQSERELCSVTRILPQAYLNFRRILENESRRCGGSLKLAQARQLIKIDVNKTRKLYDFLIQQGVFQQA